jgi:PEP-CTERM motif
MLRNLMRLAAGSVFLGVLLLANAPASASYVYYSAELDVYNSSNAIIDTTGPVLASQAVSGTLYEIPDGSLANSLQFGNADSLSTGGNSNGPYYSTLGVIYTGSSYVLGFSWDPTGNDPYGSFANNFYTYASPPTQGTYSYSMTQFLSSSALSAGDTAALVFTAVQPAATPEPASIVLLGMGGCAFAGYRRFGRRKALGASAS